MSDYVRIVKLVESLGPGWSVYRVAGTRFYKFCRTSREHELERFGHVVVYRTKAEEPKKPIIYNKGFWNEREEE